jgi:hypothetical protein
MTLPAHLLEQLPASLLEALSRGQLDSADTSGARAGSLPLGLSELDDCLPDRGLLRGAVVELAVSAPAALATSIALAACRAAQKEGLRKSGSLSWCAFIDPTATLYAPGVARAGVALERLLVVRPSLEALERVALRITESRAFAVVVIDTVAVPGAAFSHPSAGAQGGQPRAEVKGVSLASWARIVRRLALAVEGSEACVLLITDQAERRPVPLPVAMRIELGRPAEQRLSLRIAKDQRGRISAPRSVAWVRPGSDSALLSEPVEPPSLGAGSGGG